MLDWLNEVAGPGYAQAVLWTSLALLVLLVVLIVVKLVRGMTFGTFVAGGRNRKTRLAVMDATAVDSHRRLVLIRRDDVEHLVLIGGPTDVVVERDIRLNLPRRQPAAQEAAAGHTQTLAVPTPPPTPSQPALPRPRAVEPARSSPTPRSVGERSLVEQARGGDPTRRTEPERPATRQEPYRAPTALPAQPAQSSSPPVRIQAKNPSAPARLVTTVGAPVASGRPNGPSEPDDLDDELLKELAVSLDDGASTAKKPAASSLDDEMSKLLGELSNPRR